MGLILETSMHPIHVSPLSGLPVIRWAQPCSCGPLKPGLSSDPFYSGLSIIPEYYVQQRGC
jgi:hypothetical protein